VEGAALEDPGGVLVAISMLAFVLTLPTTQGEHRGSCGSAGQRKVDVRAAAAADAVAHEVSQLRRAIRSENRRRPSPSVVFVERDLLASQKLLIATGLNLRLRADAAGCRRRSEAAYQAALLAVAGAAGSPAYDVLELGSLVVRALRRG
jgi:hypothetical protein